jgi:hypothetical protein
MNWHALDLSRIVFGILVVTMIVAAFTTAARPRTWREWRLVWAVLVFLEWALIGYDWLRAG